MREAVEPLSEVSGVDANSGNELRRRFLASEPSMRMFFREASVQLKVIRLHDLSPLVNLQTDWR